MLVVWEHLAAVPRCRKCHAWMEFRSRITTFAYSKNSWTHSSSDCLAALRENLWEDAAKLLRIHGEMDSPAAEQKTPYPPIRYHLDFSSCKPCGDECALLTTEDRIGRSWNAREEYEGAYKEKDDASTSPSFVDRTAVFVSSLCRAAALAAQPLTPVTTGVVLFAALLLGVYYYPQIPLLLGAPGYRAAITIQSSPSGRPILVDGASVTTPKTFIWRYNSKHRIEIPDPFHINGDLYRFQAVAPASEDGYNEGGRGVFSSHRFKTITIEPGRDLLDRPLANRPLDLGIQSHPVHPQRLSRPGLQRHEPRGKRPMPFKRSAE